MNFLIDAQLPPALANWLILQGHKARNARGSGVGDRGPGRSRSKHYRGAIVITKDEDFAHRTGRTTTGPAIVWLRLGNATNRVLIQWLSRRWEEVTNHLNAGDRLIEVR